MEWQCRQSREGRGASEGLVLFLQLAVKYSRIEVAPRLIVCDAGVVEIRM